MLRQTSLVLGGLGLVVGAWWFTSLRIVGTVTLPPPDEVFTTLVNLANSGLLFHHFSASITMILAGFAIGAFAGLPVGVMIGYSNYWRAALTATITTIAALPGIAYGVLMLAAFGLGSTGPVLATAMVAFPYVVINVAEGIRAVDPRLIAMSRVYGRSRYQLARHILLPSVAADLTAGLRDAFAQAWKIEALVEVFGATAGIGFMIRSTYQSFSVDGMLAWTISFILFMLVVERVVLAAAERRVLRWSRL